MIRKNNYCFVFSVYHQPRSCGVERGEKKPNWVKILFQDLCNTVFIYAHEMIYDTFRI